MIKISKRAGLRITVFWAVSVICAGFFVENLYAQSGLFDSPVTPTSANNAKFKAVCALISAKSVVKGNFSLTKTVLAKNEKRELVSSGTFLISAELGMVWNTELPVKSGVIAGKDFMILVAPNGKRNVVDSNGNKTFVSIADALSAIFTGKTENLSANFTVFFLETGGIWTIGLEPKDAALKKMIARILISGASGSGAIQKLILDSASGGSDAYALSSHSFLGELTVEERAFFNKN
ncbi:MAG: hypothetical protein Ta2A_22780 [Treponemataceae bacterium]|nr:MAG: hypothetical protein Ta2A_22780 [Treponemataceae bacterium]